MAVKRCESNIDVVKAAEIRIKNVFGNGLPVFFSFSGGKDSLCLAQLMVNLANRGEINMKRLIFIKKHDLCILKSVSENRYKVISEILR